jgi:hypothetical protein
MLPVDRLPQPSLKGDVALSHSRIVTLELGEHLTLNEFQVLGKIEVTVRKEGAIRGVVVFRVEVLQIFILQVRNEFGLTTRVELVL